MFQYAGLYIFTDANVSAVYTKCNMSRGEYPCKDGLSCYTHKQMCDGIAACSRDHRDEMGCQLNQGIHILVWCANEEPIGNKMMEEC